MMGDKEIGVAFAVLYGCALRNVVGFVGYALKRQNVTGSDSSHIAYQVIKHRLARKGRGAIDVVKWRKFHFAVCQTCCLSSQG